MKLFQNEIRINLSSLHPFLKIAKYETGKNLSMELYQFCVTISFFSFLLFPLKDTKYGSLPKTSNTLNIRTPKIIAKNYFKMFPKISNSG